MTKTRRERPGLPMHFAAILIAGVTLSGCASHIMNGFVGRDIGAVIARYGPYESSFEMADGRRAFQWRIEEASMVPTETISEDVETRDGTRQTVRTTGGYWQENTCFYTMYAVPSQGDGWTIVGFEKPSLDCE